MAKKIIFTAENKARLDILATKFLFDGTTIRGVIGSVYSVWDLIHNITVPTLRNINTALKDEISKISNLDEWSLTEYQKKKQATLGTAQELVNLLIGYKLNKEQEEEAAEQIKAFKEEYKELKKSTMSPEDRLKALEDKISSLGGTVEEPTDEAPAPAGENVEGRV